MNVLSRVGIAASFHAILTRDLEQIIKIIPMGDFRQNEIFRIVLFGNLSL